MQTKGEEIDQKHAGFMPGGGTQDQNNYEKNMLEMSILSHLVQLLRNLNSQPHAAVRKASHTSVGQRFNYIYLPSLEINVPAFAKKKKKKIHL